MKVSDRTQRRLVWSGILMLIQVPNFLKDVKFLESQVQL